VPDGGEWAGVRFRGEDAGVGLGDGTLDVAVDRSGRAQGTVEGPLGPLHLAGRFEDGVFSAALTSNEPSQGFSGIATGTAADGGIGGTMRLSLPTGNVLREAPFTLERKH
jgi:hypothetical protein